MIEVQHLTKRYGRVTAVDDVSFRVERGEIVGFLGPNGAGKTTTMRVITGYMPPTEGRVVAVDTPDNLTRRLRGAESMYVLVDADRDAAPALQGVAGVTRVAVADRHESAVGYEVESVRGEDVRRDLARAVVSQGWGLLELRPLRVSLEDVFLRVTTEEQVEKTEQAEEATA